MEATRIDELVNTESQIRKQALITVKAEDNSRNQHRKLSDLIGSYHSLREKIQRQIWSEKGLAWCQRCKAFYPQDEITFLYTEGDEDYGSEMYQCRSLFRRIRSFCKECVEIMLSSPRGGDRKFQCFRARKDGEGFQIFVSGQWQPLPVTYDLKIDIERDYIPESEYEIGLKVTEGFHSPRLQIGEETIIE